ncbi:hypothetical protein IWX83_003526, partial [Flavobacterium sp. CG_9.1]|nr:hypothetical protein [Flavobacterium sp. CG_9.1]
SKIQIVELENKTYSVYFSRGCKSLMGGLKTRTISTSQAGLPRGMQ